MNQLLVFGMFLLVLTVSEVQLYMRGPPVDISHRNVVCNEFRVEHPDTYPMAGHGDYIITTDIPRYSSTEYNYTAGRIYTRKPLY